MIIIIILINYSYTFNANVLRILRTLDGTDNDNVDRYLLYSSGSFVGDIAIDDANSNNFAISFNISISISISISI